jgi:hypothetical protein
MFKCSVAFFVLGCKDPCSRSTPKMNLSPLLGPHGDLESAKILKVLLREISLHN